MIHFAGLKAVGESETDPLGYYDANVGGLLSLLQAMAAAGCRRIIFSSSATVYGEPVYLPYDEGHPLAPTSVYGRTKLICEQILGDWARATPDAAAIVLRYFNPVGAHPSGRIGEDPSGVPQNLMPFLAQVASGRQPALRIWGEDYDTPDGTGVRDYIHVMDLARAHVAALDPRRRARPAPRPTTSAPAAAIRCARCMPRSSAPSAARSRWRPIPAARATSPRWRPTAAAPRASSAGAPSTASTPWSRASGPGPGPTRRGYGDNSR